MNIVDRYLNQLREQNHRLLYPDYWDEASPYIPNQWIRNERFANLRQQCVRQEEELTPYPSYQGYPAGDARGIREIRYGTAAHAGGSTYESYDLWRSSTAADRS